MKKDIFYNAIAIISTLGILCWLVTDFFGGMFIFFLSYALIILPVLLLYVISFINTLISAIRKGIKQNKIKIISHLLLLIAILIINLLQSELVKPKRILTATLKDDLFRYTLIFRENGNCENEVYGVFGFHETIKGKYKLNGDTILFIKKPYDNNFIPDTLLIDKKANAIFIKKDAKGNFQAKKEWLNHFEIKQDQQ